MKKKFGFTLAEVLITLGIIGVVAALTAPALVKNSGQSKIGPALSKFVNTFETGVETMMTEDNISSLKGNVGGAMVALSKYIVMTPLGDGYDSITNSIYDANGSNKLEIQLDRPNDIQDCILGKKDTCTDQNGDGVIDVTDAQLMLDKYSNLRSAWQLKDGSVMYVLPLLEDEYGDEKGPYKGVVAEIIYDIDGQKSMNKTGKDVFAFLLDGSGVLIPVGSKAHKYLEQDGSSIIKSHDATCAVDSNFDHNFACTGRVADNGWKADY